ncbi:MAG: NAD(P)H-dependent oxidoreductase subunit E, partial [Nitrospirota bacterium]
MERLKNIDGLKDLRVRLCEELFRPDQDRIRICCGTACTAMGSKKVVKTLEDYISKRGLNLEIVKTGCQGLCQKGPVMKAEPYNYFYQKVGSDKVEEILSTTYSAGLPVRELLYKGSFLDKPVEIMEEVPFYKKQLRVALRNNGKIDPCNIYHYIAVDGYKATEKIFSTMSPEDVLEEVKKSNIRGRGGAG